VAIQIHAGAGFTNQIFALRRGIVKGGWLPTSRLPVTDPLAGKQTIIGIRGDAFAEAIEREKWGIG
jgi:hypothetical protein